MGVPGMSGRKPIFNSFSQLFPIMHSSRHALGFMRLFFRVFLGMVFFVGFVLSARAQVTGGVSGCLRDSIGNQQLQGASIVLLRGADSVAVGRPVVSNADACFLVGPVPAGKYILRINFVGYEPYYRPIELASPVSVDLGILYLRVKAENLNRVTIVAPPLVVLKKDTVEYNAAGIRSREYDDLQDLLRKMPGIQIAPDGTLMANGERVEQLLVDGKPFFGGDPATALQNLPAGIVDKVQVYKARSDREAFTGFSQGPGRQTMNISVKKNMARGDFGKAGAGGGTGDTWTAGLNLNHFDGPQQLSLLSSANNINNQSSPVSSTALNDQSNAANPGILKSLTAGINYRDSRSSRTEGSGSYLFGDHQSSNSQQSLIQNLFPGDSSTTSHQQGVSSASGSSHNFSLRFTEKPDKDNLIVFNPGAVLQHSVSGTAQTTFLTGNGGGVTVNGGGVTGNGGGVTGNGGRDTIYRSANQATVTNDSKAFSADLSILHRFEKTGGSLAVEIKSTDHHNLTDNLSHTQTEYLLPVAYGSRLNKFISQSVLAASVNPSVAYTQPIDKHQALQMSYEYSWRPSRSTNRTYDYNNSNGKFDQVDTAQSNDYRYISQSHLASVGYRLQLARWQLTASAGWRWDLLSQQDITVDSVFRKQYRGLIPTAGVNYAFSGTRTLQMNYSGSFEALSIQQLQPVSITLDSLFIQKGNPSLRQPFKHIISFAYRSIRGMRVFSAGLNGTVTMQGVAHSVIQLDNGAQVSTPVNLNGAYDLSLSVSYGLPLKKLATNLTISGTVGTVQSPELLNGLSADMRSWTSGLNLSSATTIRNRLDWTTDLSLGYNANRYAFGQTAAVDYLNLRASSRLSYFFLDRWALSANTTYTYNNGLPAGFRRGVLLLSPALSRRVLRNKAGEVRLLVFDLLGQNSGVSRSVGENRIVNLLSEVRGRYGMISFSYTFRRFPGLAVKE